MVVAVAITPLMHLLINPSQIQSDGAMKEEGERTRISDSFPARTMGWRRELAVGG